MWAAVITYLCVQGSVFTLKSKLILMEQCTSNPEKITDVLMLLTFFIMRSLETWLLNIGIHLASSCGRIRVLNGTIKVNNSRWKRCYVVCFSLRLRFKKFSGFVFTLLCQHLKKYFIYLFVERGEGRETSMCGCLSSVPYCVPGSQPRHVPWLGIEPVIFWFTGQCSIHWATPGRALC